MGIFTYTHIYTHTSNEEACWEHRNTKRRELSSAKCKMTCAHFDLTNSMASLLKWRLSRIHQKLWHLHLDRRKRALIEEIEISILQKFFFNTICLELIWTTFFFTFFFCYPFYDFRIETTAHLAKTIFFGTCEILKRDFIIISFFGWAASFSLLFCSVPFIGMSLFQQNIWFLS